MENIEINEVNENLIFELQTCLKINFEKTIHYIQVNYLSLGESSSFPTYLDVVEAGESFL